MTGQLPTLVHFLKPFLRPKEKYVMQWFCYLRIASFVHKFLFRRVPGCTSIADLSLKIVFWTHKFAVGTHWYWKQRVPGPISSNCKWITGHVSGYMSKILGLIGRYTFFYKNSFVLKSKKILKNSLKIDFNIRKSSKIWAGPKIQY